MLTFVFVHSFYLHIKNGIRIYFDVAFSVDVSHE